MTLRSQLDAFCVVGVVLLLSACAATSHVSTDLGKAGRPSLPASISVQPCVDRTGTHIADLGRLATEAFIEKLDSLPEFVVRADGDYELVCEVTGFLPGNAVKRWIMPGWGATVGKVSAMVQDALSKHVLVIVEGDARVGEGGLYTIGAWQEIVPSAVKATVSQLQKWARGEDL
mgnify:FL=1